MSDPIPQTQNPVPGQTNQPALEDVGAVSFSQFSSMCEGGKFNAHATAAYRHLLVQLKNHIIQTGAKTGKGRLTLTFDIVLDREDNVDVLSDIKLSEPKPPKARTTFWMSKNDVLTQVNPNQGNFGFRMVAADGGAGGDKFKQVVIDQ